MTALKRWVTSSEGTLPSVILGVILAMLLKPMSIFLTLSDGRMPGNDDYVRLAQVRDWMNGAGWFDLEQARLGAGGIAMHWSRTIDPFIVGLIRVFEPVAGPELAERMAAIIWPMLLFALVLIVTIKIARLLAPGLHPALICTIGGLNGAAVTQFEPGRIDHHNVQILLMMVAVLGGVDRRLRRGGVIAGLACAASMMIGMESLVVIGVFGLLFALRWVVGDDLEGARFGMFGAAFAGGITIAYVINTPPTLYFSTVCDQLSLAYGLPGIVAGITTYYVTSLRLFRLRSRLGACTAVATISVAVMVLAAPDCLRGPYAAMSEEAASWWLPLVSEAQGLITSIQANPEYVVGFVIIPVVTIVAGTVVLLSADTIRRWDWATLLVPVIVTFGLSFVQVRQGQFTGAMGILLLAASLPLARRHLAQATYLQTPRTQAAIGGVLLVLSAAAMANFLFLGTDSAKSASDAMQASNGVSISRQDLEGDCLAGPAIARLGQLPAGRILNPHKLSGRLLTATPHTVLVGPYHRDERAVLDGMVLVERGEAEVRQIVQTRSADYVVLCLTGEDVAFAKRRGPNGFFATLARDGAPDWLNETYISNGLAVYEVE